MPSENQAHRRALIQRLTALYQKERDALGDPEYLRAHASPLSIERQVDVFEKYARFVAPGGRVLDWGCHHAPDACMLRETLGAAVTLEGCDFAPPGRFRHFHGFAGLAYRQLDDPIRIPYDDQTFDVVISSGALEHAAMDFESLEELHRIIKENGHLIITFLPNRFSYTECLARIRKLDAHQRLYGRVEARRMLLHHGFIPVTSAYHQFLPAHRGQGVLRAFWSLNPILERTWPLRLFCANIMLVARRVGMV